MSDQLFHLRGHWHTGILMDISVTCFFAVKFFCTSYAIGCPPVRVDNARALASGLSYVEADNPWYNNYFIPSTSVLTLHSTDYFMLKLVRVVYVYTYILSYVW